MMKWGRKGSRSSPSDLVNYVFPISWLRKLKRKSGSYKAVTEGAEHKAKGNEMTRCASMPTKFKEGRFYSGTDDLYWRLSFGEDSLEQKKGRDVGSIRYHSDEAINVPKSICRRSRSMSRERNRLRSNDTIMKKQYKVRYMQDKYQQKGMKSREERLKAPARYARKDQEQRPSGRFVAKEKKASINSRYNTKQEGALRSVKKESYGTKALKIRDELEKSRVLDYRRKWSLLCPSCSASMSKENCIFDDSDVEDIDVYPDEELSSEMQRSKQKKNQIILQNEHHRLSIHLSRRVRVKRRKANRRIKASTGKIAAKTVRKTRAAEFMKKEKRVKRTRKDIDIGGEAKTAFDSYAVRKSTYDPQQEFRDSMFEMIIEKGIKQPDELEELLVYFAAAW